MLKGFSESMKGNFEGAILEFKNAAQDDLQNPYPHIFLADLYSKTGSLESSVMEFNRASELAGPDPYIHVYIGQGLLRGNNKVKAKDEFLKASLLAGESKAVHENLAKIFYPFVSGRHAFANSRQTRCLAGAIRESAAVCFQNRSALAL